MSILIKYRAHFVVGFAVGFALFIFVIFQSTDYEKDTGWYLLFLGSGALTHTALFLFLLTEAVGPIAQSRNMANRILAWIFMPPSGVVSISLLYGFVINSVALLEKFTKEGVL